MSAEEKVAQVIDLVKDMTALELVDLKKAFEETFDVQAAAPMMMPKTDRSVAARMGKMPSTSTPTRAWVAAKYTAPWERLVTSKSA